MGRRGDLVFLPYANSQPNLPEYGVYSQAMWSSLESAWTGVRSPVDAVAELEAELTSVLGDELVVL